MGTQPLALQLISSVARVQSVARRAGTIRLLLGCNLGCTVQLSGSVRIGSHSYPLAPMHDSLTGNHARTLALALSPGAPSLPDGGASAEVTVRASSAGQPTRIYRTHTRMVPS